MQVLCAAGRCWRRLGLGEVGDGARAVLPLAAAVAGLGVVFGGLATAAGLSPVAAAVMSATTFAGSAQFAAVSILGAGGSVLAAAGAAILVNARYVGMGAAVAGSMNGRGWRRVAMAQLVVDESWAIAYLGEGRFSRRRLLGAGSVLYLVHVVSTTAGTVLGRGIRDPLAWGLDGAFAPLFVVLLWPHLSTRGGLGAALSGAAIALALAPVVPPGLAVVGAGAAALLAPTGR
jgi:branched chain amino acid efflux pump